LKHLLLPFSQFWEKGLGDEGHGTLGYCGFPQGRYNAVLKTLLQFVEV
jgi:hypothetical protein